MILMVLTSHRADCFSLCLKCLERFTDLSSFERVYIMANALEPGHRRMAAMFASRHQNVSVIDFEPRGFGPVMVAQSLVWKRHEDSVIVKLDEDVFVAEGWLQGLLAAYDACKDDGCGLVSALVPNNEVGRQVLHAALCGAFPEYAGSDLLQGGRVSQNPDYAVWLWRQLFAGRMDLTENGLLKGIKMQRLTRFLNINCILFPPVFTKLLLSFDGTTDEWKMNNILRDEANPLFGVVTPHSLAHHYSFGGQQEAVDREISMSSVFHFFERQWE